MKESKIFYLDKENNIVEEENAYKSVIQVYEDGILVDEIWSYNTSGQELEMNDMDFVYVNEADEVVPQEEATHVIYRTLKDGKVISETKFELSKSTPKI